MNNKQSSINNNRSFTLIELMLYMGIMAMLLIVITDVFVSILDVQLETQATSYVEQDGSFLLSRFTYDLHQAKNISIPAAAGQTTNTLTIQINGKNNTYALDGNNNLVLTNLDYGANNLNSFNTKINQLQFTRVGNANPTGYDTIQISFTVEGRTLKKSGSEIRSWQTTVSLRPQL